VEVLGTAILIKPDSLPERTETGKIVINPNSKEMLPEWGVVIQAGRACTQVRAGDRVHFPRKSASVIEIEGVTHYFTNEHKIFYHERERSKK
jgi:co-chaperonin GroES (HSP10)